MKVAELLEKRLLRPIPGDPLKSGKSLEVAGRKLGEAKRGLDAEIFGHTVTEAYMAMFHAARAVLYRDGVQEKSHVAVVVYLEERYGKLIPADILNLLNVHRPERHEELYGLDYLPAREDAEAALADAQKFVKAIRKLLGKNTR